MHQQRNHASCYICNDEILQKEKELNPECCRTGWIHKLCVQTYAESTGFLFKCPICYDVDKFRNYVIRHGVNVLYRY